MKKGRILICLAMLALNIFSVQAATDLNGWSVTGTAESAAEICSENVFEGKKAMHITGVADGEKVKISKAVTDTGDIQRTYSVTFYAKGTYDADKIRIGWGDTETGRYPVQITIMPLSHEKVTVTEAENGWKKYNYLVAAKGKDIPEMSFEMSDDFGEIFIDGVTLEYDSVVSSRDTTGYLVTGQGLLEGDFEDIITDQNGNAPEDFGWTYAHNEGIARVVRTDGGRALYVKNQSSDELVLERAVDITSNGFSVTFKMKGAYTPKDISVGANANNSFVPLVGGVGSGMDSPYGDNVTAVRSADGWTTYTVKISTLTDVIKIKIATGCAGAYIDDISLKNASGGAIDFVNGAFDEIPYNKKKLFAENWKQSVCDDKNYTQREALDAGYAIYMQSNGVKTYLYQEVEALELGEYQVNIDVLKMDKNAVFSAGFADDLSDFIGTSSNAMTTADIGNDRVRYTFITDKIGKIFMISTELCKGIYIDNVSVKDAGGTEKLINGDFTIKTQPPATEVGEFKLYYGASQEETFGRGQYNVRIDVENNLVSPEQKFTLIICQVRGKKQIQYIKEDVTLTPNGETASPTTIKGNINITDYADGDKLEVYLWDSLEGMKSLCSFCTFGTL